MSILKNPWEESDKPYWTNPENGIEWWIDTDTTKYCKKKKVSAICFFIVKNEDGKREKLSRSLIDIETSGELKESPNLETILYFIDALSLSTLNGK